MSNVPNKPKPNYDIVWEPGYTELIETPYRDMNSKRFYQYTINYLDGSSELFKVPNDKA